MHDVVPALGDQWSDRPPPTRTTRPGAAGETYELHVVEDRGFDDAPPSPRVVEDDRPRRSVTKRVLSTLIIAISLILAAALAYVVTNSDATESLLPVDTQPPPAKAATSPPSALHAQSGEAAMPAQPPQLAAQPIARPPIPDVAGLVVLIRNAVIALQQANVTGNYSVLREIAAPKFQEANSAARLIEIFTDLRSRNLDLAVVAVTNPRLYRDPIIDDQNMLRLVGSFPTASGQVDFDLAFQMIDARWRLFGIGLNPGVATKAAEPSAADTAATQSKPGKKPKAKPADKPTLPDSATMVTLIRGAVIALNQANMTGNYSVLRDMSAPGFQAGNSFAKISGIFANLRNRHLDLAPVAAIDPSLFRAAAIDQAGLLRLTGYFASRPEQVNFDLAFQKVEEQWRLFGIGLNTSREQPLAAAPPAPDAAAAAAKDPPASARPKLKPVDPPSP